MEVMPHLAHVAVSNHVAPVMPALSCLKSLSLEADVFCPAALAALTALPALQHVALSAPPDYVGASYIHKAIGAPAPRGLAALQNISLAFLTPEALPLPDGCQLQVLCMQSALLQTVWHSSAVTELSVYMREPKGPRIPPGLSVMEGCSA